MMGSQESQDHIDQTDGESGKQLGYIGWRVYLSRQKRRWRKDGRSSLISVRTISVLVSRNSVVPDVSDPHGSTTETDPRSLRVVRIHRPGSLRPSRSAWLLHGPLHVGPYIPHSLWGMGMMVVVGVARPGEAISSDSLHSQCTFGQVVGGTYMRVHTTCRCASILVPTLSPVSRQNRYYSGCLPLFAIASNKIQLTYNFSETGLLFRLLFICMCSDILTWNNQPPSVSKVIVFAAVRNQGTRNLVCVVHHCVYYL